MSFLFKLNGAPSQGVSEVSGQEEGFSKSRMAKTLTSCGDLFVGSSMWDKIIKAYSQPNRITISSFTIESFPQKVAIVDGSWWTWEFESLVVHHQGNEQADFYLNSLGTEL